MMKKQVGWVWEDMDKGWISKYSVWNFQGPNKIFKKKTVEFANLQKDSNYGQSRGITVYPNLDWKAVKKDAFKVELPKEY